MKRALFEAAAFAAAAVPFAFALIRAVQTGHDYRYFWVALGGLAGAAATMAIAGPGGGVAAVVRSGAVFVSSTVLAVLAAILLGTRLGLGVLVVGAGFGWCFAVGSLLHERARSTAL